MSTGRDFHSQDVAIVVLSAVIYLLDVATDVVVVIQYMFEERLIWFSLSLAFVVVPMVCIQILSLKWLLTKRNTKISCMSGFLHFIGLALIKRYADVLQTWSEVKTTSNTVRTDKVFQQVSGAFLLQLFQTFLEAAPQLILQSYVLLSTWHWSAGTGFSLLISLISFSWGFVSYSDNLRLQSQNIPRPKWPSFLLQIGWQLGMMLSRVAAIIMFAFCFKNWIFFAIGVHWLFMSLWIVAEKPDLSTVLWKDRLLSCIVGFIYIFGFLHIQKGSGRWRLFFFYALYLLENSLAVIAWLLTPITIAELYQWLLTALVFSGFLIGVICLLLFYFCFHPDQKEPVEDTLAEDKVVARIERAKPTSSSLTSHTSLMNKHIIDSSRHITGAYPCREDPIGCYSKMSDNIQFFSRNDDSPSISGSVSSAINQGILYDESSYPDTTNKIFTSSVIDEESTPYNTKSVKRKLKQGTMTLDRYKRKEDVENDTLKRQPVDPRGTISKAKLMSMSKDMQNHPDYHSQISQMQSMTLSPMYHLTKERHPLGRHHSENIKSSSVSTLDHLSNQYHAWQESREGSDHYLEMLEKYRDHGNKPAKYTYLNSVYQPTTKPMECKTKEGPLTRLRSSFRRHLSAIKTPSYKEMSPVLNPGQYCTSQESLDSKSSSLQPSHPWSNCDPQHYSRQQIGRFYDVHNPRTQRTKSEDFTYHSYVQRHPCHQVYSSSGHCRRQCCNPAPNCNNYCSHKRMSYAENCSHSNMMDNAAAYQVRKATSLENVNVINESQSLRNFPAMDPHVSNQAIYRTLPHKQSHYLSQYPCSSAFSPCYEDAVYNQAANAHLEYNYKQEPSDTRSYVVYSDKPSANRCTSAPPNSTNDYGSLRGRKHFSRYNNPKEPIVDEDFRYCTISSRRSESAPPTENLFRASFKNLRKLPTRTNSYNSNTADTDCYDFRQLTISPIQSMSVPPDKVTSIEALRNLTVSPVRSVSVIPDLSPKEQECYSNYAEPSNRAASVPADYNFHNKTPNFSHVRTSELSIMPEMNCNIDNQAQRTIVDDHCLSNGQYTVYSDFNVSIPPDSQTIESGAENCPPNRKTLALQNKQSPLFSCKHPYLPEQSLSVPFNSSHSTDTETDTTSVTSLSTFPDSVSETRSAEDKAVKHLEALDNCLNFETNNLKSETDFLTSHPESNEYPNGMKTVHRSTKEANSQNTTKYRVLQKMSLRVNSGVGINPVSLENKEVASLRERIVIGDSFNEKIDKTNVGQQKHNKNGFSSSNGQQTEIDLNETESKILSEVGHDINYNNVPKNGNYNLASFSQYSSLDSDEEEQPRKPQVPKDLPKEKTKVEDQNRNFCLSPLTVQQLKDSPLKLGRSQSVGVMDKNCLSKLKDKLSPLRIQTLVNSPFKLGRSIDLFDRKKWRSTNDILDVVKSDTPVSNLIKDNYSESKSNENVKEFQQENIVLPKKDQIKISTVDSKMKNLPSKYHTNNNKDWEDIDNVDVNSSNLGTSEDYDWALDVLNHLSRISDHHVFSSNGNSLAISEKFKQRNITIDLEENEARKCGSNSVFLKKTELTDKNSDKFPSTNPNNDNVDVNTLNGNDQQESVNKNESSTQCQTPSTMSGQLQQKVHQNGKYEYEQMDAKEKSVIPEKSYKKEETVLEIEGNRTSTEMLNTHDKSEIQCEEDRTCNNDSKYSSPRKHKKFSDIYPDAKLSYVEDYILEETILNWKASNQPKETDFNSSNNKANDFNELNNSFFREKLVKETNYLWGNPLDRFKHHFSTEDLTYGLRKFPLRTQSFQSRFPRTVSRPVDPQVMPTIFENKIMTEQFIYDDAIPDMNLHNELPQQSLYYAYDDQRYTNPNHPLYMYERSLSYLDSVHPDGYMTIPSKKTGNSWNSKKKKLFSKNSK
ncbi:uncharacterized protein LOC106872646 isoform X1 [Argonauta hians]